MSKHRELPAFQTNKFQVGDIIRVFTPTETFDCLVKSIKGDRVYAENSSASYHFKQCRKLEEVNLKEFYVWINRDSGKLRTGKEPLGTVFTEIKVREVIED